MRGGAEIYVRRGLFSCVPPLPPLSSAMRVDAGLFLESNGIVKGNRRRSDTNPENDQPFPELHLSSVRGFPGSIQCIPDIWLRRVSGARKSKGGKSGFIYQGYLDAALYPLSHASNTPPSPPAQTHA